MTLTVLRSRAFGTAFLVLALSALAWGAWRSAPELGIALVRLAQRPWLVLLAFAGYVGFVALLGALWHNLLLRLGGGPLALRAALGVQAVAWSARYLPGKIGLAATKTLLVPGERTAAIWAVAYEQVLFLAAGVVLLVVCCSGAAALRSELLPGAALAVALLALGLALLGVARFAPQFDAWVTQRAGGGAPRIHPSVVELVQRTLGFVAAHAIVGAGFVALLAALGHGAAISPLYAVGALTAAHLGGIVAVFAPAGLGVRDALLAALLAPALGPVEAGAVALLARGWATLGDLLIAPAALLRR